MVTQIAPQLVHNHKPQSKMEVGIIKSRLMDEVILRQQQRLVCNNKSKIEREANHKEGAAYLHQISIRRRCM